MNYVMKNGIAHIYNPLTGELRLADSNTENKNKIIEEKENNLFNDKETIKENTLSKRNK